MLKFNEKTGTFLLFTTERERAEAAGLSLSTSIRGPEGELAFFTGDHNDRPVYNPYAALEFYQEADDDASDRLRPYVEDYQSSWADSGTLDIPYPDNGKTPMPFQFGGVEFCVGRRNSIVADEPGLGKTIQALLLANVIDARRVLVLCPASIRTNWRREIYEWSSLRNPRVGIITTGKGGVSPFDQYTVCSYDLARNPGIYTALMAIEWDLIIADEGHYLKTSTAQRTRALFGGGEEGTTFYEGGLAQRAERIVSLTGTPLPNRPREAYTLARGLNWEAIDYASYEAFLYRFNPSLKLHTGHTLEEKGRLGELNARLRCNLMVRRHKKDVLPQLPDKRYEMTYIEPDGRISEVLAREALIDFDPEDIFTEGFTLDGTPISTLRREMGEAMVPRIVEYMRYLFDIVEAPKLILFAHHTDVLLTLEEKLSRYNPVVHRGGMKDTAKDESLDTFVHGESRLFIAQLDTMEGVDGLQHVCEDVVFGEPAWTPGRNEQCVDRVHRIGQHDNVRAHFLLVEGSFNEKVVNTVLDKAEDIHNTLDRRLV